MATSFSACRLSNLFPLHPTLEGSPNPKGRYLKGKGEIVWAELRPYCQTSFEMVSMACLLEGHRSGWTGRECRRQAVPTVIGGRLHSGCQSDLRDCWWPGRVVLEKEVLPIGPYIRRWTVGPVKSVLRLAATQHDLSGSGPCTSPST